MKIAVLKAQDKGAGTAETGKSMKNVVLETLERVERTAEIRKKLEIDAWRARPSAEGTGSSNQWGRLRRRKASKIGNVRNMGGRKEIGE